MQPKTTINYLNQQKIMWVGAEMKIGTLSGPGRFNLPWCESDDEDCCGSQDDGRVFAALESMLNELPEKSRYRTEIILNFTDRADALIRVLCKDGFRNISLHDPDKNGGKKTTGAALFTDGMAWGINQGIPDRQTCEPVVSEAWNARIHEALHKNRFPGNVQGNRSSPSDDQPVTYHHQPDFEEYGPGCFLPAGSEGYQMTEWLN